MFPWPDCCETAAVSTPLPTAVLETPSWVWAKRSANSARDSLNPVVLTFARLFEVTLRSVLAALMPERARSNDMWWFPQFTWTTLRRESVPELVFRYKAWVLGSMVTLLTVLCRYGGTSVC